MLDHTIHYYDMLIEFQQDPSIELYVLEDQSLSFRKIADMKYFYSRLNDVILAPAQAT